MAKKQFYNHPTLGRLPLVPHPTLEGRLVAYHGGRAIYECDAQTPEPEKKRAPKPTVPQGYGKEQEE